MFSTFKGVGTSTFDGCLQKNRFETIKVKMTKKSQGEHYKELIFEKVGTIFFSLVEYSQRKPLQFVTLGAVSRLGTEGFKLQFPL